jgi:hypothetical protein
MDSSPFRGGHSLKFINRQVVTMRHLGFSGKTARFRSARTRA